MQLVLSWLEEDGDGVVVVLGSFEGQVEGEAGGGVASLPAGGVIDTSMAHIDQPLVHGIAESEHWQSQQNTNAKHHENMHQEADRLSEADSVIIEYYSDGLITDTI